MGLALARKDRDAGTANALGFGDERAAVARIAAGRRRDRPDAAHMQDIAQGAKAPEGIECRIDRVSRQQPGRLHLPSQPGQHLFIEDRRRRARQPFVNDEANRVRADIDDGNGRPVVETAFGGRDNRGRTFTRLR